MNKFEQYVKTRTEKALKEKYYDPMGNSDLATHNKSVIEAINYSTKVLCREIKTVATQPVLEVTLGDLIGLIIVILLSV